MRICVLQPDYTGSTVPYRHFDPPRDLRSLLPDCEVDNLFLRKATVYRQLREASARGYDVFVNLCEGYLDWDIPSLDVIWCLDRLRLPYTGPGARLYDPSKALMKYVAYTQGVLFPAFAESIADTDCEAALAQLRFPLFVKPAHAGDSLGIDADSRVETIAALRAKCLAVIREFGRALIEEYIDGREFTVLVMADPANRFEPIALRPLEFVFPAGARFKTYALKVEQHHPECNLPVEDVGLDDRLRCAARKIFAGFEGKGYARLDFRMDSAGSIYFLDINFACSVFYPDGYEGSADYILASDPLGRAGFLRHIIEEGIARHRRSRPLYERRPSGTSGFGIFATEDICTGQVIYRGEESAQRLVSRDYAERHWPEPQRKVLNQYAIPLSAGVVTLWSDDPEHWAPRTIAVTRTPRSTAWIWSRCGRSGPERSSRWTTRRFTTIEWHRSHATAERQIVEVRSSAPGLHCNPGDVELTFELRVVSDAVNGGSYGRQRSCAEYRAAAVKRDRRPDGAVRRCATEKFTALQDGSDLSTAERRR